MNRIAAIVATAVPILSAAACGGGPATGGPATGGSPGVTGPADATSAVGFAHCMRGHGVPKYPDPGAGNTTPNGLPKVSLRQLGVTAPRFQAAQQACRRLLPDEGRPAQSASQQLLSDGLKFARCVRSHGVPSWPDPARSTPRQVALGAPAYMFHMDGLQGLDGRSFPPQVTAAMQECLHLTHLTGAQVPDWSG